jgi:glycosyltransferase involved in cell wall biosynthesis
MRQFTRRGHEVTLLTRRPNPREAIASLGRVNERQIDEFVHSNTATLPKSFGPWQRRFCSYWGVVPGHVAAVGRAARSLAVDAVVVLGADGLPYLGDVRSSFHTHEKSPVRVWYVADDLAWHALTLVRLASPATWGRMREAAIMALYERSFRGVMDRVWVVNAEERRAARAVVGMEDVEIIPNGVDAEYFAPRSVPTLPRSCVFWGRLDFGPNRQALDWFFDHVWAGVRRRHADALFSVFGFHAPADLLARSGRDGVEVVADLPDLRDAVCRRQVAVLPFVSGGGIKNKLLEAAAMAMPIVCSPRATLGLRLRGERPLHVVRSPEAWVAALTQIWENAPWRQRLGETARAWVVRNHSWETTANLAETSLLRGR